MGKTKGHHTTACASFPVATDSAAVSPDACKCSISCAIQSSSDVSLTLQIGATPENVRAHGLMWCDSCKIHYQRDIPHTCICSKDRETKAKRWSDVADEEDYDFVDFAPMTEALDDFTT